ncbi:MAG: hypothetical protein GY909_00050 [Oligoflexia bacterium]|nr:hypothetical protein [Oligoflexia bacterium]
MQSKILKAVSLTLTITTIFSTYTALTLYTKKSEIELVCRNDMEFMLASIIKGESEKGIRKALLVGIPPITATDDLIEFSKKNNRTFYKIILDQGPSSNSPYELYTNELSEKRKEISNKYPEYQF